MPSEHVVRKGAVGKEMFFIYRGKCTGPPTPPPSPPWWEEVVREVPADLTC